MENINQKEFLEKLGIAAFGKTWKADLADALPVARPTITDWVSGKKPIPVGVWSDIQRILNSRLLSLQGAALELSERKHIMIIQEMQRKSRVIINDVFGDWLNLLSDNEIQNFSYAYEKEYACCSSEYPSELLIDLSTIKDAIQFQICVRSLSDDLDLATAEEYAISYMNNLRLAADYDFDAEFMIEQSKEIISK